MDKKNTRPISPDEKNKIIQMYNDGKRYSEIGKTMNISEKTVSRIIKKSLTQGEIKEREPPVTEKKETERPLDQNLKRRTEQKIVEYGSDVILQDFKLEMRMARVLHEKELKYRTSIENLGMSWETYVSKALDWAYNLVLQTWEEEVQYMVTRDDLEKMAIVQQVYNGSAPANPETREDDINE